jgi:DNA-binding transcriptional regulator YdaS (Cro superfamily)
MNYLQKTIDLVGGQSQLAKKITRWHSMNGAGLIVRQQYVWKWLNSDSPMPPAEHCRAIEDITNGAVTRYDLRPDVFGASADCESNQTQEAA